MKKVFSLLAAIIISGCAIAQDDQNKTIPADKATGDKYCVALQDDGKVAVVLNGKDILGSVTLTNGTVIKANGTVIKNGGSQLILNDGECVDSMGNKVIDEKSKPMKKEDKMSPGDK